MKSIKLYFVFVAIFVIGIYLLPLTSDANTTPYQLLDSGLNVNFGGYGNINCNVKWDVANEGQGSYFQEKFYYKYGDVVTSKNAICGCIQTPEAECHCQGTIQNPVLGGTYYYKIKEDGEYPEEFKYLVNIPTKMSDDAVSIDVTSSSATIEWTTDESLRSNVFYYQVDKDINQDSVRNDEYAKNHIIKLDGLNPGTEYGFTANSIDGTGYGVTSGLLFFTTESGNICHDSDGGQNYEEAGQVTFDGREDTSWGKDDCVISNGNYTYTPTTYCQGNNCYQREKVCDSEGIDIVAEYHPCPDGCTNGACQIDNKQSCQETDSGDDIYTKGKIILSNGFEMEDTCDRYSLRETYCVNGSYVYSTRNCKYGCDDGACKSSLQDEGNDNDEQSDDSDEVMLEEIEIATCIDDDGGKDYSLRGTVKFGSIKHSDECQGNYLVEYWCSNNQVYNTAYRCPDVCIEGACTENKSSNDSNEAGSSDNGQMEYLEEGSREGENIDVEPENEVEGGANINISIEQVPEHVNGRILLKTEDAGKAYYVNPQNKTMHYLGTPEDAYSVMRINSTGITNNDLYKIPIGVIYVEDDSDFDGLSDSFEVCLGLNPYSNDSDGDGYGDADELNKGYSPWGSGRQNLDLNFSDRQKGRIFLQIEKAGEAWYVNPEDNKRYFLGRPSDAFNVMRNLGLGISNKDFKDLTGGE